MKIINFAVFWSIRGVFWKQQSQNWYSTSSWVPTHPFIRFLKRSVLVTHTRIPLLILSPSPTLTFNRSQFPLFSFSVVNLWPNTSLIKLSHHPFTCDLGFFHFNIRINPGWRCIPLSSSKVSAFLQIFFSQQKTYSSFWYLGQVGWGLTTPGV